MNRKIYKTGICIVGAHLLIGNMFIPIENTYYTSFAEERVGEVSRASSRSLATEALGEAVLGYGLGKTYDAGFATYLNKRGITKNEYETYIDGNKKYANSDVEKVYKAENLMYLFDVAIYTHPVVKSIYKQNVATFKNKDTSWTNLKKGAIYDVNWLSEVFDESLDRVDMVKAYKYLFKKEPTPAIEKDLSNKSTIKYGLYSGLLKKELAQDERDKIKNGLGYTLLGISKSEYEQYKSYSRIKEKIVPYEAMYIKKYSIHSGVRTTLKNKLGVDIYQRTSDAERLLVYKMSLTNFNYDKNKAEKAFRTLIKRQEELDSPATEEEKPENNEGISDSTVLNPVEEEKNPSVVGGDTIKDYEYLDKGEPDYGIFGPDFEILDLSSKNKYTAQYYYSKNYIAAVLEGKIDGDEKRYVIKLNGANIPTSIPVEDVITNELFLKLMEAISEKDDRWKTVSSLKEHLVFISNKVETMKIKEEYSLKELNEFLRKVGVEIKEMSIKEIIALEEQEKMKEEGNKEEGNKEG